MKHEWQYCSLGGVIRVKISSGEDIAHLGELDEKYWTVLSCPVDGLVFDKRTLAYLDADGDGKIRVPEVVAAADWLCSCISDRNLLLKGDSELPLSALDESSPLGSRLKRSARQILDNLKLDKDSIGIDDAADSTAIFAGSAFNGDGVITALTAGDDAELKQTIADCIACFGPAPDRSGEAGVTAATIEQFYAACSDYSAWRASAAESKDEVLPYGDDTAAAYAACCAVKDKLADFFMRCRLLNYDSDVAAALDVKAEKLEDLASCPIARPDSSCLLHLDSLNPAWAAAVAKLRALVPDKDFSTAEGVSEQSWNAFCSRFDAYAAWTAAKKGAEVEQLGADRVEAVLKAGRRADLLALVDADSALREESDSIDDVKKLMFLYRDFGRFLRNYVTFYDFYERGANRAAFEAGRLFIDQRCCDLCIRVSDMSAHNDMAKLSGMFLIYCRCSSKKAAGSFDIAAVMTAGDVADLRAGKNGIFYDLQGHDWDAVITKVVDNPVSIGEAFWSPYRKFWEFCVGLINKSAADKENKVMSQMQTKAAQAAASAPAASGAAAAAGAAGTKPAFDIAKFAGIFAAIGLALGYIGSFLTQLAAGIARTPWWQLIVAVLVIMLIISGPSCFIAWSKLRRRNLGPVLNANGWAINSKVLVNILFGSKLTSVARYPKLNISDPYSQKTPRWKKWLGWTLFVLVVLALLFFIFRERIVYVFF